MADDSLTSFSAAFPDADEAQWRALVEKALKGKGPEALQQKTRDGITIKPLYRESDWPSSQDVDGLPGAAPFVRGKSAEKDAYLPWDIRQFVEHPIPKLAHDDLIKDLERGVSSVELRIDITGDRGVAVQNVSDLSTVLDGVMTDLAAVALSNSALQGYGLEAAALLVAWSEQKDLDPAKQKFAFNLDPIGELARSGALSTTVDRALTETIAFTRDAGPAFAASTCIRVDGRPAYEAGGTEAQELALALSSGVTYLRAMLDAGMTLQDANKAMIFCLSAGPDYAREIAKFRAMRRLWSRVTESFGEALPLTLQVVTARRMLTIRDPWVNMLRNTAACFAAGVGGADIVSVRPFTQAIGLAGPMARRIGRNTQIMAQEESSLGKVVDPAAGTWAIGRLSEELAHSAWSIFQSVEGQQGIGTALTNGSFQTHVSEARQSLMKDVARRKQPVTGVSEFPLIDEEMPETVDVSSLPPIREVSEGSKPASRSAVDLVSAASTGASLSVLFDDEHEPHAQCDPLFPMRLSEPFELLRDHADEQEKRPEVFLACMDEIAVYNARASFAANFFAAGGIAATTGNAPYSTMEDMVSDFKESGDVLVCICSSDACYAEHAAAAAKALREVRPDARIYLAGKPGDAEAAYREAGIDDFIFVGVDVVSKLEIAHAELGLS
ncbi:MAG: methylmalonyl-CoA mutase [Ponticaulis sp.]|nr:methylmalonyl-CoA mutase [Ponticaulis sp.]